MKRIKRVLLLTGLLGGAFSAGVYAQDILQRVDAYLRPDFKLVLDGKPLKLEAPTLVYDSKSYLPLAELGRILGANVYWKGDTNTIYINSRINPEQNIDDTQTEYQKIELYNPTSFYMSYLGAQYPMLITYDKTNYDTFYRESDIRRMGINTNGLKKAKERLTNAVFIAESELKKRWGNVKPEQVFTEDYSTYIISQEPHPTKQNLIKDHVKNNQARTIGDAQIRVQPIIVDKDTTDETYDTYQYLYQQTTTFKAGVTTRGYYLATLKLNKYLVGNSSDFQYSVAPVNTVDLASEAIKRENP